MARLHTIGFELNDTTYETGTTFTGTPTITGSPVRTGSYALSMDTGDWIGYSTGLATEIYMGFGLYINEVNVTTKFIDFYSSGGSLLHVEYVTGGNIRIVRGATVLATSTRVLETGGWYYGEIYYKPDQSAGVCTVRVNNSEWVTASGDTMNNGNVLIHVRVGNNSPGSSSGIVFDDLVINDSSGAANNTWPGNIKLHLALPNAAGDATQLTPSATADNYTLVDERPPSTSDYVFGSTATNRDLYNISDPLAGTETLGNVTVNYVAKLDTGSGNLAPTVKANVTEDDGTTVALTENWTWYQYSWNVNPDDSAAWAPADIDGLQIGVEIKA